MRAVRKHVTCTWALLYIERWLKAPMVDEAGKKIERTRGTPQGGVVSPLLSTTFLHFAFDPCMTRTLPYLPGCRYADARLLHYRHWPDANALQASHHARFARCGFQLPLTTTPTMYSPA